jgi:hypothetical protein
VEEFLHGDQSLYKEDIRQETQGWTIEGRDLEEKWRMLLKGDQENDI